MENFGSEQNQQISPDIIQQKALVESQLPVDFQVKLELKPDSKPVIQSSPKALLPVAKQTKQKEKMADLSVLQNKLDTGSVDVQDEPNINSEQADSASEAEVPPEQASNIPVAPVAANTKIKRIIEALLFAAEKSMTAKQLHAVFPELEAPDIKQIQVAIDALCYDYRQQAIGLHQVANGYRFQVKVDMASWVARLFAESPPKYSQALLETIAIIAYQQPVTRGDIEEIRGVSVSTQMIRTLLEREWIKVLAYKESPGKPALYGTTKAFLDYFNLPSLDAIPPLEELQALALEGELEI